MQAGSATRHSHQDDEGGVVAVVEFLSAFTLFLMILTAFMSLAQLELGSNDPYTDIVDRSAVDGLDRLTSGEGWYVPYTDVYGTYQPSPLVNLSSPSTAERSTISV